MPSLCRITVYPIKSLDGKEVSQVEVLVGGALAQDRRYALVDSMGRPVNGKRFAAIHQIRAMYSDDWRRVTLAFENNSAEFLLTDEAQEIAAWIGERLEVRCRLVENDAGGFPDDSNAPGPTIVSTASMETVAQWFGDLPLDEMQRRLRANLEISDTPPFWEDQLAPEFRRIQRFRIGNTAWQGQGVCERCNVPPRDSRSGVPADGFAREFAARREQSLPDWSPKSRFDHFYRLAINTSLESLENGNIIQLGDEVELIGGAGRVGD